MTQVTITCNLFKAAANNIWTSPIGDDSEPECCEHKTFRSTQVTKKELEDICKDMAHGPYTAPTGSDPQKAEFKGRVQDSTPNGWDVCLIPSEPNGSAWTEDYSRFHAYPIKDCEIPGAHSDEDGKWWYLAISIEIILPGGNS